jgi:two-component system, sensor histidine kinase and response regulator
MESIKNASQAHKIDMAELLSRVDNDHELLRDVVSIFQEDFPRHLEALRRAVAVSDLNQVKITSHTMKGMLANLSADRGAASAAQLEQLAGTGLTALMPNALAEFEQEVEGLLAEIQIRAEEAQR